jgi:hypothetical protein
MGEVADIVNSGIAVIHLMANHSGVQVVQGGYATGFPAGFDGQGLSGGQFKSVGKRWKQDSAWYDFTSVDMDFTVNMHWLWGASIHGAGHYIDQITVTLDVEYLPPDQTVDVTANFPTHGSPLGSDDDVIAALPFTVAVQMNYFLGQLVGFRKTLNCLVQGDGTWQMS